MSKRDYLLEVITTTADYLTAFGAYSELDPWITDALKTVGYYARAMWDYVLALYRGKMDGFGFVEKMMALISGQLRRAWNEGMRVNGLDPKEDMTAGWEGLLQGIIADEYNYMVDLGAEIEKAAIDNAGYDQFRHRIDIWVNRYNDVVNRAILETAGRKDRFKWTLGDTEEHCTTCSMLDGHVAWAEEWWASDFHPQLPPNPLLECGGWQCGCRLEKTEQRRSPDALDTLMNLAVARRMDAGQD